MAKNGNFCFVHMVKDDCKSCGHAFQFFHGLLASKYQFEIYSVNRKII
jgi:hypothetical protein